ncbi:Binding-protein-dependent transport systems inner membrane component [Marinomonas sp. MED121]|uniref:ABC transporter permease n=1 Tax=Marinomonas sp. MED121 TaxID=314277 RepID=UPI00006901D8|nr:ABC transporter permease [Marinomonas sp. MED121]EAQ64360.1 Binding-protein-dependent transport systems inner membrane component [Marinomonas sp. MED121]
MSHSQLSKQVDNAPLDGNGLDNQAQDASQTEIIDLTPKERLILKMKAHRGLQFGVFVVGFMVLMAIFAPLLAPHDPYLQDLTQRLVPPVWSDQGSWNHILGTDNLGRDYLSRLIYGGQVSLAVGFGAAGLGCFIGVLVGLSAGYFGGRVDQVASFMLNCQLAIPSLLLAMALVFFIGASVITLVLVLGCLHWSYYMVVTRTMTKQIRALEYVMAAKTIGSSNRQILFYEILPNLVNQVIVVFSLEVAVVIIAEASMSFLGVGVQPPTASWGLMIAEGKAAMYFSPYLVVIPGTALFLLVLAVNLLGDGIRDVTAPEGRN